MPWPVDSRRQARHYGYVIRRIPEPAREAAKPWGQSHDVRPGDQPTGPGSGGPQS